MPVNGSAHAAVPEELSARIECQLLLLVAALAVAAKGDCSKHLQLLLLCAEAWPATSPQYKASAPPPTSKVHLQDMCTPSTTLALCQQAAYSVEPYKTRQGQTHYTTHTTQKTIITCVDSDVHMVLGTAANGPAEELPAERPAAAGAAPAGPSKVVR